VTKDEWKGLSNILGIMMKEHLGTDWERPLQASSTLGSSNPGYQSREEHKPHYH
jgi:hypothetical protein